MAGLSVISASKKQKLAPVQVFLRIRPKHNDDGASAITYCTPKGIHMKGHLKGYTFDQIFDEKTTQLKVYKTVVGKMITDVSKGYNCTIFAYGQTGTGKTYTVIGDDCVKDVDDTFNWQHESSAGIILRAAMHLYEELDKLDPSIQRTVTVSFMEIYNEEIRDLLCDRELTPLRKGCEKRQVASTLMNNRSSRSHTVFTISVSTMQTISMAENISNITCGKLNLIDIAGSENIAKSGSKDQRVREATNINQSLLTLGRVIKALVENSSHVPYRESKLTRILQASLGGKAKTSIIATISPGVASLDESLNTLDYAYNARNITSCPTINLRVGQLVIFLALYHQLSICRPILEYGHLLYSNARRPTLNNIEVAERSSMRALSKIRHPEQSQTFYRLRPFLDQNYRYLAKRLSRTSAQKIITSSKFFIIFQIVIRVYFISGVYMDKENYDEMTQCLTQFKKEIANKHEAIIALRDQVEDLEAQRHEWENLKESFRKTSQACQAMQSETQRKEKEMLRDTELLQYYKSESNRLKEIADLLLTRENHLHKKLNHVYASSSKNQNVVEDIISMVEKTINNLIVPKETNNFSANINSLLQFNMKVCQMFANVIKELEIKSHKFGPNDETEEIASDNYSRTILGDVYETIQYLRNKFEIFTDTCNSKILEIQIVDSDIIIKIQEALQEGKKKKTERKALLNKDFANYRKFEENLNEILGRQRSSILEYFEERQKSIEREHQRIQEIREMLKKEDIQKEIADYEEKRRRIFDRISSLDQLEDNAHQKINNITEKAIQCIGSSSSNMDKIKNCVLYIRNETSKVCEHVLNEYREQNSEMANVLLQISHILDIAGKTHIEMVNESLSTTGKELKESVKRIYETSLIPITRTGDTPKPMEGVQIASRSERNSMIKNLFSNSSCEDPTDLP